MLFKLFFCVLLCFFSVVCQLDEENQSKLTCAVLLYKRRFRILEGLLLLSHAWSECVGEEDGINGTCVRLHRCLSVVNDLRQRNHPQLCSFDGRDPIICCTDCELVNDLSHALVDSSGYYYFKKGSKAEDKCLEYRVKLSHNCTLSKVGKNRELKYEGDCYEYNRIFGIAEVGGKDAEEGQFPHMALLGYGTDLESAQWLCGGSLISDRFILTAGHCISSTALGPVRYAAMGILKRTDPPTKWQRYNVQKIIPYPQYKPPLKYHDIALLQLGTIVKFGDLVKPACLNTGGRNEALASATGWGALGHRQGLADTLQVIFLDEFTTDDCAAAYPSHRHLPDGYDQKTQSCYGDKTKIIDTCEGDSGGPLQIESEHGPCIYMVIGVTSYGRQCGFQGSAGMYTRVSYYVPWIESIVWP